MADDAGGPGAQAQDDTLGKYKRLLSMARSSLEANQASLLQKDQQIAQLVSALEEEKSKRGSLRIPKDEEGGQQYPRRIVSRVDVEGLVWVLLEYEGADDDWKSFPDEMSLHDFIKRAPGIPLICPQTCLSADESARVVDDAKKKIDKVVEEFRRYKVRMEIALKQKDQEAKPSLATQSSYTSNGTLPIALEKALSLGAGGETREKTDEVQRMKQLMHEQEAKWRHSCEKLSKELDALRTRGAESVVASQWRSRYELCARERDELQRKFELYSQLSSELATADKSVEELYLELSEAYKGLRRRVHAFIHQHATKPASENCVEELLRELSGIVESYRIEHQEMDDLHTLLRPEQGDSKGGTGMAESKVQYVRQMMIQYFLCSEEEVKQHIEAALMAIFRFTDEEKASIEGKRKDEGLGLDSTLSTFTTFLGSFASS